MDNKAKNPFILKKKNKFTKRDEKKRVDLGEDNEEKLPTLIKLNNNSSSSTIDSNALKEIFNYIDVNNKGYINLDDLKDKIDPFFPAVDKKEYQYLMNNKSELTEQELYSILSQYQTNNFDPILEAFKIYDPYDTGYIDFHQLMLIFDKLNLDANEEDIKELISSITSNESNEKISLEDFRLLLS